MTDTIDRIQVEFSTNIREFTTQLSGIESGVGNVAKTFSTVESASQGYTSAMDSTATATTAAVASITEYTAASVTQASAARTAADETESQGRRSAEAFQGIKEGFVQIKTVLGMLGVSVGLGALISQIKQLRAEAEAAGKAYGRMYNTIYYTTGELTGTQKELADSLRLEGFDTTAIAETVARLTALFPDAESTVLETGETALAQMAEEVLWMERKGYGDVSSLIDGMNDAFKKWSVPSGEITGELGYLAAAYRDTNTDVTTLLSSLTRLDEVGRTLGFTFRDMVDFIGAANVAGNLEDLSNVGMRFESQYTARVSDIYQALLNADRETLTLAGLGAEDADSAILQVASAMSVDESAAKTKAQELAGTIVTAIFREANREASVAVTQAQASQIWADALDIEVSRMTNRLADLSMSAVRGYENIRTANRDIVAETGQTTTILVKVDKGLGTSDYAAKTEAAKEDALRSTWAGTRTPLVEKRTSAYIDEGKDYWSGYGIANLDVELSRIAAYLLAGTGVLKNLVSGSAEEPADGGLGMFDTISRFFAQLSPVGVASAAEMEPLFNGEISATGDVHLSPAESMAISADSATVVADHVSADTKEVPDVTVDVPDVLVEPDVSLNPAITVEPQIAVACAAPDISVHPSVSVNPSISVNPDITVDPTVSVYPFISVYPDFSLYMEPVDVAPAPESTEPPAVPDITVNPTVSVTPEIMVSVSAPAEKMPDVSVTPEISVNPEISLEPDLQVTVEQNPVQPVSVNPVVSVSPDVAVYPDISVNPAVSVMPDISVEPLVQVTVEQEPAVPSLQPVSVKPEIAVYPDISVNPAVSVTPEISVEPLVQQTVEQNPVQPVSVNPVVSVSPEVAVYPDISVNPAVSVMPDISVEPDVQVTVEQESAEPVTVIPEVAVYPDISVNPAVSVTPEISVEPLVRVTVEQEPAEPSVSSVSAISDISVYPDISFNPEITVSPAIAAEVSPEVSVIPEISIHPVIGIEPLSTPAEEEPHSLSPLLSTFASFFDRISGRLDALEIPADSPEPVYLLASSEKSSPEDDAVSPVSSAFNSLLATMDSGNSALLGSMSALNRVLMTLADSLAKHGSVTVNQYISAPVADSYVVRNAAAAGISAAQAGSFRL